MTPSQPVAREGAFASWIGLGLVLSVSSVGCEPAPPVRDGHDRGLIGHLASESIVAPSASVPPPENSNEPPRVTAPRCNVDEPLPPEPVRPPSECNPQPEVKCVPPSPVRSAWQPPPFVACPPRIEQWGDAIVVGEPRFSPRETRARRLKGRCEVTPEEGECCYVEFASLACD